jgi:hypothetical protein
MRKTCLTGSGYHRKLPPRAGIRLSFRLSPLIRSEALPMIAFDCPHCGTRLAAKNRRKLVVCKFCKGDIEPDEIEPISSLRAQRDFFRAWRVRLWGTLAVVTGISLVLVLVAIVAPRLHQIAVWWGVAEWIVAGVLMYCVCQIEQNRNPVPGAYALAGPVGAYLYYMVRWPQPALIAVLGVATMIGAVAFDRSNPPPGRPAPPPQLPPGPPPKATPLPERPSPEPPQPVAQQPAGPNQPFDIDPVAKSAGRRLYVVALTPFDYQPGPWRYAAGATGSAAEHPIKVQDRAFPYGISACPPDSLKESWRVSFVAGGEFRRLRGGCGLNDYVAAPWGKIAFSVWGDGKKLWESTPLSGGTRSAVFDVDVSKVKVLTLETRVVEGSHLHCHAVWLDPWLER